ncbi:MAG TPA: universal stress protein [Terracidiphilus sp.]|nr:universal stress protein [Terracidiphilus sp.]
MAKNAIASWSNPEVILVVTTLLENHTLMLHALFQAKLSKATVLLVHVIPPSYLITEDNCSAPFVLSSPTVPVIRAKLDEAAKEFQREGILCEPVVFNGLPEEEIPLLVKSRSVDRVIVATRNISGVARLIEGSVAEKLIEVLEVPVCVIGQRTHAAATFGTPLGRVLLATSLRSTSSLLASFASALAEINHAHLTLLHVLISEGISEQQFEMAQLAARRRLSALVPNEARHRFQPLFLVREGDPATVILEEADSLSQDIVILGSPHSATASRLLSNSVVHRVVLESHCPVITIKSKPANTAEVVHRAANIEAMSTHS